MKFASVFENNTQEQNEHETQRPGFRNCIVGTVSAGFSSDRRERRFQLRRGRTQRPERRPRLGGRMVGQYAEITVLRGDNDRGDGLVDNLLLLRVDEQAKLLGHRF